MVGLGPLHSLFWGSAPRPAPFCFGAPPHAPRSFVAPFFLRLGGYEKIIGRSCAPLCPMTGARRTGFSRGMGLGVREFLFCSGCVVWGRSSAVGCWLLAECRTPSAYSEQRSANSEQRTANSPSRTTIVLYLAFGIRHSTSSPVLRSSM
jgi:hypothetical protein